MSSYTFEHVHSAEKRRTERQALFQALRERPSCSYWMRNMVYRWLLS